MFRVIIGILFVLHGLVHMLYFGHSKRAFEMKPGMAWPDGAWIFSHLFKTETIRNLAGTACVISAVGFVIGGIALLARFDLWRPVIIGISVFSSLTFIFFWNGTFHNMDGQGWVGVLINTVTLVSILVFKWPAV